MEDLKLRHLSKEFNSSENLMTMKKLTHLFFILFSLISLSTYAQTSNKTLNYQAVILDPNAIDIPGASISGQPLNKGKVCLRFSLLNAQGGLDYEETQQVTTDEFGLVSVAIGAGSQALASNSTSIYKSFESIVWNANMKSLKVSVSYDGCSSFKQVSTQIFNYTPYALYAEAVDYKNVREAPTKLSQFSNDAGFLIPKDLDPLKTDIQSNSSKIATANQNIADNKQANDAAFLVVNQSLTSLDEKVADNKSSITKINTKLTEQQNQISDNRNQIAATNSTMNAQIGGLQGQLNVTNSTVSNLSGAAEVVSNKSASTTLGGANASDQLYPTQKATKTYVDLALAQVANGTISDATTVAAGKIQLAGDLGGTATNPTVPALATKENTANKSTNVLADGTNDTKYPSVKAVKDYVDQATLGTALAADLANKANILSPTFTGVPTAPTPASSDNSTKIATTAFVQAATAGIALQASVDSKANINSPTFTGTPVLPTGTTGVTQASGDNSTKLATTAYVDAQVASGAADATTSTRGIVQLTGDLGGTATSPTVPGLALKANSADVTTSLALKEDVSNKSNAALGTSTTLYPTQSAVKTYVDAQVASATIVDADGSTKGKIQLAGDLGGTASSPTVPGLTAKANIASPTFTGTVTSPIYASAPQNLTDAATISWNPANGLNANVTLGGNRTLSFSTAPASGSYGTLVVTQDGTGGRTLTLPSGTNKVLGSSSTTTIALSSAAGAKDILNFYYDGLTSTYYWNVGQGYGTAATVAAVNLATGVTGTLAVTNGGTGATSAGAALTALGAQASANLSTDMSADAASTSKYPAVKTVKDYVDATVTSGAPDASTSVKGKIQLAGDLAGSATSPSVVKLRGTPISSVAPATAGHVLTYDVSGNATWAAPANSANTISGVVPVANGGTGLSSVTSGGAVYATSSNALATGTLPFTAGGTGATSQQTAINALTGTQSAGKYLRSDGTNAALSTIQAADVPTLNQNTTGTAANVTGIVGVANGGTGLATLTANNVLLGNGTSALQAVAPGTSGNVLTSDGTTWTSAAGGVPYSGATGAVNLGAYDLKVNNLTIGRGRLGVESNTAIGLASLGVNTTGTNNTGTGYATLAANTEGIANTATGYGSLVANTTGSNNTAVGSTSLVKNLTGSNNTALGYVSLSENLSGINNTGVGSYSLWKNTGSGNSAVGFGALVYNTNGSNNVAQGSSALQDNTTGSDNTAIGRNSLMTNSTGSFNTAIGSVTNVNSNNLSNTTAIGYGARVYNSNTIQLGADGTSYTLNSVVYPTTAITNVKTSGTLTLGTVTYPNSHASTDGQILTINSSGLASWATPAASGIPYSGATGAVNLGAYDLTVNGVTVGRGNMKMTNNYAFGYAVLSANTTGNYNNAFGHQALTANTTGTENNAFGEYVLPKNIGGSQNTAMGSNALKENTTGNGNTGYGRQALATNTTGSYNTAIGYQANVATNNLTNATAVGNGASVSASNTIQLGNADVTNVKTSGTITAGDITYPKTHGSANQVLSTTGSGTLTWTTPSTTATAYSGTLPIANGGTNSTATATSGGIGYGTGTAHAYSSAGTSGQVLISAGAGTPTWATLTAGTAITITNTAGTITIAAAVRPMTEQTTATSTHAVATATFTLSNTPLNSKVWMFINGVRTNNNAYTVSGTTVTYTAANNNSYTIVAGDRIQFDYAY